jgi:hypothetical protein
VYSDTGLASVAMKTGKQVREILVNGSGSKQVEAYINYAVGDETVPEVYGASATRLRKLKKQYDPQGKFSFFEPIS